MSSLLRPPYDTIQRDIEEIAKLINAQRAEPADAKLRKLIEGLDSQALRELQPELRTLIGRFYPKRRRNLSSLLDNRLGVPASAPPPAAEPSEITDLSAFRNQIRDTLAVLRLHHIFQWSTYYRQFLTDTFPKTLDIVTEPTSSSPVLSALSEELSQHSQDIFQQGFSYITVRGGLSKDDALLKGLNGLQSFLNLPVEAYSNYAFTARTARRASALRLVCSTLLAAILGGYGAGRYGPTSGWSLLPRFPRSWAHFLGFLNANHLRQLCRRIEPGDFRLGIESSVLPVVLAIDRLMAAQSGDDFCLPRLGQFSWDARRLEISLSHTRAVAHKPYLEIHAYLSSAFLTRSHLEESVNRGITLVAAPLRADLRDWALANEALRPSLIDTGLILATTFDQVVQRALDVLHGELARLVGGERRAEPVTFNLARSFPLQDAFLSRYFLVQRKSVRELLQTFEKDKGVRLWCSVRRSGKTTSCFDLGSTSPNCIVVTQTMDPTDQFPEASTFYERFTSALESERQLPLTFFSDAARDCARAEPVQDAKLIFVLDEYETLFDRLRAAVGRNRELRYTVVQPLLNQMVAFSRDNLLIFIGQRPDSHYIIMDQNQLSPYVRQDPFPLFQHASGALNTEFGELVRKVLTERVEFDAGLVDAIFLETRGHPYLTVNLLVDFFDWLIENGRRADQLTLTPDDFAAFGQARLTPQSMRRSSNYELFVNVVGDALTDESRRHTPWLYCVYRTLQEMARRDSATLACSEAEFRNLCRPVSEPLGWDPDYILKTAQLSNFLAVSGGSVSPAIPLMGRIAMIANPRIA